MRYLYYRWQVQCVACQYWPCPLWKVWVGWWFSLGCMVFLWELIIMLSKCTLMNEWEHAISREPGLSFNRPKLYLYLLPSLLLVKIAIKSGMFLTFIKSWNSKNMWVCLGYLNSTVGRKCGYYLAAMLVFIGTFSLFLTDVRRRKLSRRKAQTSSMKTWVICLYFVFVGLLLYRMLYLISIAWEWKRCFFAPGVKL